MAVVRGKFIHLLLSGKKVDNCSRLRHWLACRGLCRHKYKLVGGLRDQFFAAYSKLKEKETMSRKQELKDIIDQVYALNLPDGAYWAMINERFTGDSSSVTAQDMIGEDPEYYGWSKPEENNDA